MRHRNTTATLNRPADQRKALVRNLVTSLFLYGKVKTTNAKAKVLVSEAEKLITAIRKNDDMNAIRKTMSFVFTEESSKKALDYARNTKKTSGFTRQTKLGYRDGDAALMVMVELIDEPTQ